MVDVPHQGRCAAGQVASGASGFFWDTDPRPGCKQWEKRREHLVGGHW